ncbi:carbohydrate esterase family 16 protein [Saccharata proteae CBS 121410]|uniref:Carbohydrate esterase family 16 protein n=1 Tax=Saccharata proteae CBS 121410 TaxID=1314787 RepID=A0A9P4I4Z2_9PEZI|nr:carbohydrate esterase family 16 protein [Saccharata proteae CBS 121410]
MRGSFFFTGLLAILPSGQAASIPPLGSWQGFARVKYWFVFGDSYTTTGFNVTGLQPSHDNALGNPAYPGYTSSNGPNWVDFLTTQYNKSMIQTYNLAYGGATVDQNLVAQYLPTVLSVRQQVHDEFMPCYGSNNSTVTWASQDTLFSVFIGINDVGNSYQAQNTSLHGIIFDEYASLVEELYGSGARNFLFLNVPPVQCSPGTVVLGASDVQLEADAIKDWNFRLEILAAELNMKHSDATIFRYDTYSLFNEVLENPSTYPATSIYKNTTGYCVGYENGTPAIDTFYTECDIPVNEYFWLNSLHPTYPMQDVLASQVAELLKHNRYWPYGRR